MDKAQLSETVWRRGWKDTKAGLGDWRFWAVETVGGLMIGAATESIWVTLIFVIGIFAAVYIGATLRAPYRQRDEARAADRDRNEEIKKLRDKAPRLECEILSIVIFGLKETDENDRFLLVASVTNAGGKQAAVKRIQIHVIDQNDRRTNIDLADFDWAPATRGGGYYWVRDDALYERALKPIAPGGWVNGIIVARPTGPQMKAIKEPTARVVLSVTDVHGRTSEDIMGALGGNQPNDPSLHYPGLTPKMPAGEPSR